PGRSFSFAHELSLFTRRQMRNPLLHVGHILRGMTISPARQPLDGKPAGQRYNREPPHSITIRAVRLKGAGAASAGFVDHAGFDCLTLPDSSQNVPGLMERCHHTWRHSAGSHWTRFTSRSDGP